MKCYNCGNELPSNSKYCLSCGKKVGDKGNNSCDELIGEPEERKINNRSSQSPRPNRTLRIISGLFAIIILFILAIFLF